jgi:hypothetical protein
MENWKDIPGYEGRYQVSDRGNVRSLSHRVRLVVHGVETTRHSPGRQLRPAASPLGHLTVVLGKGNTQQVHGLVALAFIGPRPTAADVAHRDGEPGNNMPSNLRYATRSENNQDKVFHGRARLSVAQIERVREEARTGPRGTKTALAQELGVSQSTISDVLAGRTYSHV